MDDRRDDLFQGSDDMALISGVVGRICRRQGEDVDVGRLSEPERVAFLVNLAWGVT